MKLEPQLKIGRLTVIGQNGQGKSDRLWEVICDCGTKKTISAGNLSSGRVKSCGCFRKEFARTLRRVRGRENGAYLHGQSRSLEHNAYCYAKARCNNPKVNSYPWYGERGIKFLFESFSSFYEELGPKPKGFTLDRIDPDGHYEKGNVRWADWGTQRRNQKRCHSQK